MGRPTVVMAALCIATLFPSLSRLAEARVVWNDDETNKKMTAAGLSASVAGLSSNVNSANTDRNTLRDWRGSTVPSSQGHPTRFPDSTNLAANIGLIQDAVKAQPSTASAAAATAPQSHSDLAQKATDPTGNLLQFQIQNEFVGDSYKADDYANTFTIQPVLPLKMGKLPTQIIRLTVPIVTTPDMDGPIDSTTGLGDITFLDLFLFEQEWGTIGVGPTFVVPSATDPTLGSDKLQMGPVVAVIYKKKPKWQFGFLYYNFWSIAGNDDRKSVNKGYITPILTRHFDKGWYAGAGDMPWVVDWNEDAQMYLPLSARVGKVTRIGDMPVNFSVQPFYAIDQSAEGQAEWGVKVSLTLLFPL